MREGELREHAKCALCGNGIGAAGPLFWTAKITSWILDMRALQRQTGMEMMMGGQVALAHLMGPNEDMAKKILDAEITVCQTCAEDKSLPLMAMIPEDDEVEEPSRVRRLPGQEEL